MKRWKKGLLAGMLVLALAGCGGATEEAGEMVADEAMKYVKQAQEMLEQADGFAADFRGEVLMQDADNSVTEGSVLLVKEPLYMKVDMEMSYDGVEQDYEMFLEETADGVNQYMSYDGEWTEMTLKKDAALTGAQIYHTLHNLEAIFSAAEGWTLEKDGSELVLQGVIPKEGFYAVESATRWFQLAGMSGLAEQYYAEIGDVPVKVVLDGKTGAPLSYEVDLAQPLEKMIHSVLAELNGGELEEEVEVEKYIITSAITQLGGVKAEEIPLEAKSAAINYEKEISLLAMAAE